MAGIGVRGINRYLLAGMVVVLSIAFAGSSRAETGGVHSSIVGGEATSINEWPWQVALVMKRSFAGNTKPSKRLICGGSLLTPTIVLTAAHCASGYNHIHPRNIAVIGGRTNLDHESEGRQVPAREFELPLTSSGGPRDFRSDQTGDIALLELAEPLPQPTVKLLGPDESGLMEPGRVVHMTGWGSRSPSRALRLRKVLRHARMAIQPDRACRRLFELKVPYDPESQMCVGDPDSRSIPCVGDSGGPAVIETGDGYRLVGVASLGLIRGCLTWDLLMDADLTGAGVRSWISGAVFARTGIDPVGSGASAGPIPEYCRVPVLKRLRLRAARAAIRRGGCTVGAIRHTPMGGPSSGRASHGRVLSTTADPFTLRNPVNPVDMVVARWNPGNRPAR
ncbi:MAG TPA: serine protease [Solirubrobacterales bacterium]|nr:serine protease [Solirubrobacterales bacterium]